jgi:formylglycine-generating enzyme required for sulfatase activity
MRATNVHSLCAIASAATSLALIGSARAAIVYSGPLNIAVPVGTGLRLWIDLDTFATSTSGSFTGWDVSLTGTNPNFLTVTSVSLSNNVFVSYEGFPPLIAALAPGFEIGPVGPFRTPAGGTLSLTDGAYTFQANSENTVGFRRVVDGQTRYGWIRIAVGSDFLTRRVTGIAYEDSGAPILAGAMPAQCSGDLNRDGAVNGIDLGALLAAWGICTNCQPDLNLDGSVDGIDLATMLAAWGSCVTVPSWATLIAAYPDPAVVPSATLRSAIAATGLAWRVRDTQTQIELALIPPGTYQRGCSPSQQSSCFSQESPTHQVTLTQPFYMGRYEVTQAQWQSRMGSNPSFFQSASPEVPASQVADRPAETVSWIAVQGFLAGTGLRLPTEAEWEYACRAGTTTAFHSMPDQPNGTNDDSRVGTIAWFGSNSAGQTRPVGGKAGNGLGLHDMSGNVWEWVNDWYGTYPSAAQTDPTGPSTATSRVIRGGSRVDGTGVVRSSNRDGTTPETALNLVGFRVARTP